MTSLALKPDSGNQPEQPNPLTPSNVKVVSIHHDQTEVARIIDGVVAVVPSPVNQRPNLLQIFWDEELVYQLHVPTETVSVNRMVPALMKDGNTNV
jgi:hypothetical protein